MKTGPDHVTGQDYGSPRRPFLINAVNGAGRLLWKLGCRKKVTPEALMRKARRKSGLDDFGGEDIVTPLRVLVKSIEEEARLNPFGRFVTRSRLVSALENRLRAERWFKLHPEILEQELLPMTVITGLQRTGTTMLHRLLAADPGTRALLSWEALNPAPLFRTGEREKRIKSAKTSENALAYIAPDFFAVHPVEAEAPEEDVLLLDFSFLSTVPEATLRVPAYSRWLEEQDQRPAYEYMRKLMLLLQWQRPAKRWILKTPHHMEYMDTLFEVFPEVRVIQTHRDPATTIASFCSMLSHGRGVFSDSVDPEEVGRDWCRKIRRMLERTMEARRRLPQDRFYDVHYEELLTDPVGTVEKIYRFLGLSWNRELRKLMQETHYANGRYRYGRHVYRLENFGLTEERIRDEFAEYYREYLEGDMIRFGVKYG
jgi:hypothetical protein